MSRFGKYWLLKSSKSKYWCEEVHEELGSRGEETHVVVYLLNVVYTDDNVFWKCFRKVRGSMVGLPIGSARSLTLARTKGWTGRREDGWTASQAGKLPARSEEFHRVQRFRRNFHTFLKNFQKSLHSQTKIYTNSNQVIRYYVHDWSSSRLQRSSCWYGWPPYITVGVWRLPKLR